jgi:hypothetical protein
MATSSTAAGRRHIESPAESRQRGARKVGGVAVTWQSRETDCRQQNVVDDVDDVSVALLATRRAATRRWLVGAVDRRREGVSRCSDTAAGCRGAAPCRGVQGGGAPLHSIHFQLTTTRRSTPTTCRRLRDVVSASARDVDAATKRRRRRYGRVPVRARVASHLRLPECWLTAGTALRARTMVDGNGDACASVSARRTTRRRRHARRWLAGRVGVGAVPSTRRTLSASPSPLSNRHLGWAIPRARCSKPVMPRGRRSEQSCRRLVAR